MPDRYIERKGIIFNQIAEKGDVDQTTKLQKENRQLMDKVENLEQEYSRIRRALEIIMEHMNPEEFNKQAYEKEKKEVLTRNGPEID
jgi:hypothetical protein